MLSPTFNNSQIANIYQMIYYLIDLLIPFEKNDTIHKFQYIRILNCNILCSQYYYYSF